MVVTVTTDDILTVRSPLRIEGSLKIYHLESPLAAQVGQHVVRLETHRAWLNLDRSVAIPEVITNFCEQHWVGCRDLGQWFGCLLSAENKTQLWVPSGFAHGFYVTSESAEFVYKCTDYYAPEFEQSILWNDPALNIKWPLVDGKLPLLSAKDEAGLLHVDAPAF